MALTNWDLRRIANTVTNKDVEGRSFDTAEIQSLLNAQSQLLFAEKIGFPKQYPREAPLSQMGIHKSKQIDQTLRPFLKSETKTISGGTFDMTNLAEDVGLLLSISPGTISGRGMDEVTSYEYDDRVGSVVVAPSADDPIFMWTAKNSVLIAPSTITSITVRYLKYPDDAVISTTTNSTTLLEEYDSSGSTELEWFDPQKLEIVYRILREVGVNLERQDVTALGERMKQNG